MSLAYRFIYFNTRGAGELCRLTLAVSGAEWQDVRYPLALAESGFSYGPEYKQDAATGAFDGNLGGKLPILQVIDPQKDPARAIANIGQSHAICRFVALQHDLMGQTAIACAQVDSLYEACRDIRSAWYRAKRTQNGKERWFDSSKDGTLQEYCQFLERAVVAACSAPSSDSPWCLGGSEPTLADVAIYHLLGTPKPTLVSGAIPSFMDGASDLVRDAYSSSCPRLAVCITAMGMHERVQEWEAKRPDTFS